MDLLSTDDDTMIPDVISTLRRRCQSVREKMWAALPESQADTHLLVQKSNIPNGGLGLFAAQELDQGVAMCFYTGQEHSLQSARSVQDGEYMLRLGPRSDQKLLSSDAIASGCTYVDARLTPGVKARFLNDCYNPCGYNVMFVMEPDLARAKVVALRAIRRGEELFVEYGDAYWTARGIVPRALTKAELAVAQQTVDDDQTLNTTHPDAQLQQEEETEECGSEDSGDGFLEVCGLGDSDFEGVEDEDEEGFNSGAGSNEVNDSDDLFDFCGLGQSDFEGVSEGSGDDESPSEANSACDMRPTTTRAGAPHSAGGGINIFGPGMESAVRRVPDSEERYRFGRAFSSTSPCFIGSAQGDANSSSSGGGGGGGIPIVIRDVQDKGRALFATRYH
jgi:hypothetical protein